MKKSTPSVMAFIAFCAFFGAFLFASYTPPPAEEMTTIIYKTNSGFRLDTLEGTETENFSIPRTLLGRGDYEEIDWQVKLVNIAGTDTINLVIEESIDTTLLDWAPVDTIASAIRMTGSNTKKYIFRNEAPPSGIRQRISCIVTGSSGSAKTIVSLGAKVRYPKLNG